MGAFFFFLFFISTILFHDFLSSWVEQAPSEPLSSLSTQFLRGLLTLGQLQQRNTLPEKAVSAEQVYRTHATNQSLRGPLLQIFLIGDISPLLGVFVGSRLRLAVFPVPQKV